jgi:hypothetical protein
MKYFKIIGDGYCFYFEGDVSYILNKPGNENIKAELYSKNSILEIANFLAEKGYELATTDDKTFAYFKIL